MKKAINSTLLQRQYKGFAEQGNTKVYLTAVLTENGLAKSCYIKGTLNRNVSKIAAPSSEFCLQTIDIPKILFIR